MSFTPSSIKLRFLYYALCQHRIHNLLKSGNICACNIVLGKAVTLRGVEGEVEKRFRGEEVEILRYEAPDVIADVKEKGYVSAGMKKRMQMLYETAGEQAKLLFHICSSLREAAEEARPLQRSPGEASPPFE